jgi:hypothetical protein
MGNCIMMTAAARYSVRHATYSQPTACHFVSLTRRRIVLPPGL